MADSWIWNLLPLGFAKLWARRPSTYRVALKIGGIGPFWAASVGGVLIRCAASEARAQRSGSSNEAEGVKNG
jgi:hypothetical protein